MITTERLYPIRRPVAAALCWCSRRLLGGLIGLGGAEFRLPILIGIFALFPHRAVRTNLLISLATLAMSAVARLSFVHTTSVADFKVEIAGMLVGGIIAAWLGAGYLRSIPKARMMGVIAALLLVTAVLLATETLFSGAGWPGLAHDTTWTLPVAIAAGLVVGAISSLIGVAGGEFIIPILIFIFGRRYQDGGNSKCSDQYSGRVDGRGSPLAHGPLSLPIAAGLSGAAHGHRFWYRRNDRRVFGGVGTDRRAPDSAGGYIGRVGIQTMGKHAI